MYNESKVLELKAKTHRKMLKFAYKWGKMKKDFVLIKDER